MRRKRYSSYATRKPKRVSMRKMIADGERAQRLISGNGRGNAANDYCEWLSIPIHDVPGQKMMFGETDKPLADVRNERRRQLEFQYPDRSVTVLYPCPICGAATDQIFCSAACEVTWDVLPAETQVELHRPFATLADLREGGAV